MTFLLRLRELQRHHLLHFSLLLLFFLLVGCSHTKQGTSAPPPSPSTQIVYGTDRQLKLKNFNPSQTAPPLTQPPLPSPPPTQQTATPQPTLFICPADSKQPMPPGCICTAVEIYCENNQCIVGRAPGCSSNYWAGMCGGKADGRYCIDKPIVYLYPPVPTFVNVKLETSGAIVQSDPPYPEYGWQNVLAMPNGSLVYHGKKYPYLFYESAVSQLPTPKSGLIVTKDYLKPTLTLLTAQLGLVEPEQKDFLAYWVPRLDRLSTPYVLVSLMPAFEKDRIDRVIVTPTPYTRIELMFLFEPLTEPKPVSPLALPPTPPARHGFTMVEWGGSVLEK